MFFTKKFLLPELGEVQIGITPENSRGQKVAIVKMGETMARAMIEKGKIRVGWVACSIRRRAVVVRCYKCLGYGHVTMRCNGPDRSKNCYKCGTVGHKAKECQNPERCVLCADKGLEHDKSSHVPGTGRCVVFREALEYVKRKLR